MFETDDECTYFVNTLDFSGHQECMRKGGTRRNIDYFNRTKDMVVYAVKKHEKKSYEAIILSR